MVILDDIIFTMLMQRSIISSQKKTGYTLAIIWVKTGLT